MNEPNAVDLFFAGLAHPLKPEMELVRKIIMAANPLLVEAVKWGGPSFEYELPFATFNPRVKDYVALVLHTGAVYVDRFPFLEAGPKGRAYAKFRSMADVERHRADLGAVANLFVADRGGS